MKQPRRLLRARLSATHRARTSQSTREPPLTAVVIVCCPQALPDVALSSISAFVTAKRWTVELASERGELALLQRTTTCDGQTKSQLYRSQVFSRALALAITHDNDLALLKCLHTYCPNGFAVLGMEAAARLGKLHVLQWLVTYCAAGITWSSRFAEAAAGVGHLEALQWLARQHPIRPEQVVSVTKRAIAGGHLATVKWLLESSESSDAPLTEFATRQLLAAADAAMHCDIVEYLRTERDEQ